MHIVIIFQPLELGNTQNQKQHKKPTLNKNYKTKYLKAQENHPKTHNSEFQCFTIPTRIQIYAQKLFP